MRWGASQDLELLSFFKRWVASRSNHPALIQGDFRTLILDDVRGIWLLERRDRTDRVLVAINVSEHTAEIALPDRDYVNLEGKRVRGMIELAAHAVDLLCDDGWSLE
jgi:glycosidase